MKISTSLLGLVALASASTQAAQLEVTLTNLTHGLHFTPVLVAAHNSGSHLFQSGSSASTALQAMAEGGSIDDLSAQIEATGATVLKNPAGGLMAPAASFTGIALDSGANTHLSLTAMLLPTNDGFVGLDSWKIPTEAGTYTIMLNAYDAGTEANDEIINGGGAPGVAGIPAAPGGDGGTGGSGVTSSEVNTTVHIHRGSLGDSDAAGGKSDLNNQIHRWLNPVAKLTVTVK